MVTILVRSFPKDIHPEFAEELWDTFFGNTQLSVIMQLDTANGIIGGGKPIELIKKYAGHSVKAHLNP